MDLRDDQLERYARHIILKEVGGAGQERLLKARVLVIGAGGLGSPIIMYLAAAGIGTVGVVDFDDVSLSNLQRQILHTTARVGVPKVESAALAVHDLNSDVRIVQHNERLTAENAARLIAQYDIIADGSDNFATRFLVNDAAFFAKKTLVSGALSQFDGQIATFKVPRYVRFVTEWPMSGTKIQKFKLRQEIADELAAAGITEAPKITSK